MTDALGRPPWHVVAVTAIALVVAAQVALAAPRAAVPGVVALAGAVVVFGVWHAIEEGAVEVGADD
jgi:uncharacterized membrane protein HdeD (DUF308 family)